MDPSELTEEKEAMLQSIVPGYPSFHNGSTSPLSSPNEMCRICHCEAESDAPLIAPCVCSGSLRFVHQACLQQWIKSSDTKNCELCKYEFIMQTKIKPFRKWERIEMSAAERRKIFCSVAFHAVAITCVVWSLYVLIDRTAEEVKTGQLEWPFWTKLIVVAIGFTGGLVFMYVQCKMYIQLCRRWKAYNRIIYVQNAPEKVKPIPVSPMQQLVSVTIDPTSPSAKVELYVTTENIVETHIGNTIPPTRTTLRLMLPVSSNTFSPLPPVATSPPTSPVPVSYTLPSNSSSDTHLINNTSSNLSGDKK